MSKKKCNEEGAAQRPSLLIKAAEVARLVGISIRTLRRLVRAKRFPGPIRIGRCARWRVVDVEEWVNRCKSIDNGSEEMPDVDAP